MDYISVFDIIGNITFERFEQFRLTASADSCYYLNIGRTDHIDNFVQVVVSVNQFYKQSRSFITKTPHLFPKIEYFLFLGNKK